MEPTMDEQTLRTVVLILRQKNADLEWQNTQLQANIIRLTSEQAGGNEQASGPPDRTD